MSMTTRTTNLKRRELTWFAEGWREELMVDLEVRPGPDTGSVVTSCQAPTVLHHSIQSEHYNLASISIFGEE